MGKPDCIRTVQTTSVPTGPNPMGLDDRQSPAVCHYTGPDWVGFLTQAYPYTPSRNAVAGTI